ncbi:MAG: MFS transporter [Bacteroidota bacterium]
MSTGTAIKSNPRIIRAWTFYDWANSAYSLVITSTLYPIYFSEITRSANGSLQFLGRQFNPESLQSYAISFSFLLVALVSPLLSSIADYSGRKKSFMAFFCSLGATACALLWFFTGMDTLWIGITCSVIASFGFSGSIVFYNAYLPEIAPKQDQDRISARGFAMGYTGSSLLLIFCLTLVMFPGWYGNISSGTALRTAFVLVGVWWLGFALLSFRGLPQDRRDSAIRGDILRKGYTELLGVWRQLNSQPLLKRYLFGFFFTNMAVQTVMYLATLFGAQEIAWGSESEKQTGLIVCILLIQFVAVGGAFLFSKISDRFGNIRALMLAIFIWICICLSVYYLVYTPQHFYLTAISVGMVMGGIQSLSRSTYSKLLPETQDHASYFSFFDVCDKTGTVIGTFTFGYVNELFGNMRSSTFVLIVFFIVGLLLFRSMGLTRIVNHSEPTP